MTWNGPASTVRPVPILSIATSGSARRITRESRHGGRHRSGCARDDRDERLIGLRERRVGERPRIREEAAHVRVGRDADDGGRRRGRLAGERDLPSDGVGGSKNLPRGELADDEDARRARPIAIVEAASAKDLDSERPEDRRRRGDRGDHARRRVRRAGLFHRRVERRSALDTPKGRSSP